MHHIYKITNNVNGKVYIGYTSNPSGRWNAHKHCAIHSSQKSDLNKPLYKAIRLHGVENFSFEVIYSGVEKDHTKNIMEKQLIKEHNSYGTEFGYNASAGGDGMTSEFASKLNKTRVAEGRHTFQSENFKETVKVRMRTNNPMKRDDVKAKCSAANKLAQRAKIDAGTHYWQSEESKREKRDRMRAMCTRPLLFEVKAMFTERKLKVPRNLHNSGDEKLLAMKAALEQKIAWYQFPDCNLSSVS